MCKADPALNARCELGNTWDPRTLLLILTNPVCVGKIHWNDAIYLGTHEAILRHELFDRAGEILKARDVELKGRQWHSDSQDGRRPSWTLRKSSPATTGPSWRTR